MLSTKRLLLYLPAGGWYNSAVTSTHSLQYVRSLFFDALHCTAQALQKLSADHALPILHCRGLSAVLMFLDFFSTGIQRIAVAR